MNAGILGSCASKMSGPPAPPFDIMDLDGTSLWFFLETDNAYIHKEGPGSSQVPVEADGDAVTETVDQSDQANLFKSTFWPSAGGDAPIWNETDGVVEYNVGHLECIPTTPFTGNVLAFSQKFEMITPVAGAGRIMSICNAAGIETAADSCIPCIIAAGALVSAFRNGVFTTGFPVVQGDIVTFSSMFTLTGIRTLIHIEYFNGDPDFDADVTDSGSHVAFDAQKIILGTGGSGAPGFYGRHRNMCRVGLYGPSAGDFVNMHNWVKANG